MVKELRTVINNDPVTLEWSADMNGYTITTASGVDVGIDLVSKGLATTSSLASDDLRNAERAAKHDMRGVWQLEVRCKPSVWWYLLPMYDGFISLLLGVMAAFAVGYGTVFSFILLFGRINYEE